MSMKGIKKFAEVLTLMQQYKHELIEMGAKKVGTKEGNQDMRLGQLLEVAKNSVKDEFTKITIE